MITSLVTFVKNEWIYLHYPSKHRSDKVPSPCPHFLTLGHRPFYTFLMLMDEGQRPRWGLYIGPAVRGSAFPSALALPMQASQAFAFDSLLTWNALSVSPDLLGPSASDYSSVKFSLVSGVNQSLWCGPGGAIFLLLKFKSQLWFSEWLFN